LPFGWFVTICDSLKFSRYVLGGYDLALRLVTGRICLFYAWDGVLIVLDEFMPFFIDLA